MRYPAEAAAACHTMADRANRRLDCDEEMAGAAVQLAFVAANWEKRIAAKDGLAPKDLAAVSGALRRLRQAQASPFADADLERDLLELMMLPGLSPTV